MAVCATLWLKSQQPACLIGVRGGLLRRDRLLERGGQDPAEQLADRREIRQALRPLWGGVALAVELHAVHKERDIVKTAMRIPERFSDIQECPLHTSLLGEGTPPRPRVG